MEAFSPTLSERAVVATVRYDPFPDSATFYEGQVRWIRLKTVHESKRRFLNFTYDEFTEAVAAFSAPIPGVPARLQVMMHTDGSHWIRAL